MDILYKSFMNDVPILHRLVIFIIISFLITLIIFLVISYVLKRLKNYSLLIEYKWDKNLISININDFLYKFLLFLILIILGNQFWLNRNDISSAWNTTIQINKIYKEEKEIANTIKPLVNNRLIAHAGGGIDTYTYTNSLEALELNYTLGHRYFEIDLNIMADEVIICAHDIEHLNSITGVDQTLLNSMDYKIRKIYGNYTVIDLEDLFNFMKKHTDMFLITDSKLSSATGKFSSDDEYNMSFWNKFVSIAKNVDPDILKRIIPQLYYPEMLQIVENYYKFPIYIFTLYATSLDAQGILRFLYDNPRIHFVTMPPARLEEPGLKSGLIKLQRPIYIHTINNEEDIKMFLQKGVYGFYTDFITPSHFSEIIGKE